MADYAARVIAIQIKSKARHYVSCTHCGFSTDMPDATDHADALAQIATRHRCAVPSFEAGSYYCEDCNGIERFCDLEWIDRNGSGMNVCGRCRVRIAKA